MRKNGLFFYFVSVLLVLLMFIPHVVFCQAQNDNSLLLPSKIFSHPSLKGLTINPQNPFDIEFIIDTNDDKDINKEEAQKLVDYFFAGLTLPEKDLWVNLAPHESERIIPGTTAATELGQGFLEQDYLLKQLAASLTYPETPAGRAYWHDQQNIKSQISNLKSNELSEFQKVWITPNTAKIYQNGNSVFITESSLKVEMEKDNTAFKTNILPMIAQQVNEGEHFAQLRQIYSALILGVWFKQKLKDSIYQDYIDKGKTTGIDKADKDIKEKVYAKYLEAFKRGAYDYTERQNSKGKSQKFGVTFGNANKIVTRRYFSGGVNLPVSTVVEETATPPQSAGELKKVRARILPIDDKIDYAQRFIMANFQPDSEHSDVEAMEYFLQHVGDLAPADPNKRQEQAHLIHLTSYAARNLSRVGEDKMPQGRVDIVMLNLPDTMEGSDLSLYFPEEEGFNYPMRDSAGKITHWKIVVFSDDKRSLAHELCEVALRQANELLPPEQRKHWTEIHNDVCDELGTFKHKFTPEQIAQYKKEGQSEIGSAWFGFGSSGNLKIVRKLNTISDNALQLMYRAIVEKHWNFNGVMLTSSGIVIDFREGQAQLGFGANGITSEELERLHFLLIGKCRQLSSQGFMTVHDLVQFFLSICDTKAEGVMGGKVALERLAQQIIAASRVSNAYQNHQAVDDYMDNIVSQAMEQLYQTVVGMSWTINGIMVLSSGIVIDYPEGQAQISFQACGVPQALMPEVSRRFSGKFKEIFSDGYIDAQNLTQYFLTLHSDRSDSMRNKQKIGMMAQMIRDAAASRGAAGAQGNTGGGFKPASRNIITPQEESAFSYFGLDPNTATYDDIRVRLRRLAKDHPDKGGSGEALKKASWMQVICNAYIARRDADEGGLMGRWRKQGRAIEYNFSTQTAKIPDATRIEDKYGVVEKEFLDEKGQNNKRDIVLNTRQLGADEESRIEKLKQELSLAGNIPVALIKADKSSRRYRVYGLAAWDEFNHPTILLREDILSLGTDEQVKEALDHEYREFSGMRHQDIRAQQYKGGLRGLITQLSTSDKASYGGIDITEGAINLDVSGESNGFKINRASYVGYQGLIPQIISIDNLSGREFKAMVE